MAMSKPPPPPPPEPLSFVFAQTQDIVGRIRALTRPIVPGFREYFARSNRWVISVCGAGGASPAHRVRFGEAQAGAVRDYFAQSSDPGDQKIAKIISNQMDSIDLERESTAADAQKLRDYAARRARLTLIK